MPTVAARKCQFLLTAAALRVPASRQASAGVTSRVGLFVGIALGTKKPAAGGGAAGFQLDDSIREE